MKNTLLLFLLLVAATAGAQDATPPNTAFRSLFQIRAAMPDTIELWHAAYNITLSATGAELVPISGGVVHQLLLREAWQPTERGWSANTLEGFLLTWDTAAAEPFFEIATGRQVVDYYINAPARLQWQQWPKM